MRPDTDERRRDGGEDLDRPAEPAATGHHPLAADRDRDEPTGQEGGRHPGCDRQRTRQRIGDERGAEQDDEQAEERRPGIAGRYRDDRPADNHRRDRCQGEVHGAAVWSSGCVGVGRISSVFSGQ